MNKIIDVVIIGRNEGKSVWKIINCLPSEWDIYYVADRCEDNTVEKLKGYKNVITIDTTDFNIEGRQTSFCRNLGFYYTDNSRDVLFLDGDRWIEEGDIRKAVNNAEKDITLFTLMDDYRNDERFDINDIYGEIINGFFSCGVLFKRSALEKLINHKALRREISISKVPSIIPQLFPEDLQDVWGIEDTSLGDVCYDLGLNVEICRTIRLHGGFGKLELESLDVIEKRLRFREKLQNIKW